MRHINLREGEAGIRQALMAVVVRNGRPIVFPNLDQGLSRAKLVKDATRDHLAATLEVQGDRRF